MTYGTNAAAVMQTEVHPGGWNTPCWEPADHSAGSVTFGEGQLLYGLIRALRPALAVEVGTSHGHATLHMAAGLRDNDAGHLHTVEIVRSRSEAAQRHAATAGLDSFVTFHVGDIPDLPPVDFAFLDARHEAHNVRDYLDALDLAPEGTVVIHDSSFQGHAALIAAEYGYDMVQLPTDSQCGMAILRRGE